MGKAKKEHKKGRIWRILLIILGSIAAFLALSATINVICCATEKDKIIDYGEKVEVTGGTMNVVTYGSGEKTIVLLPGSGNPSPGLDFKQFSLLLNEGGYKVIIPEPFGYGLSDITDRERTFENIAEELHECLSKLGYTSYVLMGHSLSGLTMLEYTNSYPDEVTAVVALDTSVPKQVEEGTVPFAIYNLLSFTKDTGLMRLYSVFDPSMTGFITDRMTEEEAETCRYIMYANYNNKNILDELENFERDDWKQKYDMKYPTSIPVLTFLSEDSVNSSANWKIWHEEISENSNSKVEIVSGGHFVYIEHPEEIATQVLQFLK